MKEIVGRPRVLVVGPGNIGPLHLNRYNALSDAGLELRVACCPMKEYHRPWKFDSEQARFSVDRPFAADVGAAELVRSAGAYLSKVCPDVVIFIGYNSPYYWATALHCRRRGIPALLYLVGALGGTRRRIITEVAKHAVCRVAFSGALVTGVRAALYARVLGIRRENIWTVGHGVDNEHFSAGQVHGGREGRFLYVGRLSPEKNLKRLLEAFRRYRLAGGTWSLRLVGTGPERDRLLMALQHVDGVELRGWADYDQLPRVYAEAGAFVLPSVSETWGLVVNEAMAAGLPVLVSRKCGCYPELCRDGVNGFGLEPENVESMVAAMSRVELLGDAQREQMGVASKALIAPFSLNTWAAGVANGVRLVWKGE